MPSHGVHQGARTNTGRAAIYVEAIRLSTAKALSFSRGTSPCMPWETFISDTPTKQRRSARLESMTDQNSDQ
jgi:hypothetical protein